MRRLARVDAAGTSTVDKRRSEVPTFLGTRDRTTSFTCTPVVHDEWCGSGGNKASDGKDRFETVKVL